jgi:DNA-binding MarR family transcriptional regulator
MVILGRLLRVGSSGAAELARGERSQPQSITRALRSLEDRGLVRRGTDDADRRRAVIEITPKGEARLRAALFGRITWLARALETRFTPEERATLRTAATLMQRLAETNEE